MAVRMSAPTLQEQSRLVFQKNANRWFGSVKKAPLCWAGPRDTVMQRGRRPPSCSRRLRRRAEKPARLGASIRARIWCTRHGELREKAREAQLVLCHEAV